METKPINRQAYPADAHGPSYVSWQCHEIQDQEAYYMGLCIGKNE